MSERRKPTGRELLTAAAEAHSDLYVFDTVVSIMDGGHLHAPKEARDD